MRQWLEPTPTDIPAELRSVAGEHIAPFAADLIARTLVKRGITTIQGARAFLDPAYYTPSDPYLLPDMDHAVERLARALRNRQRILIWGDFDVDGQTATALLLSALRAFGADVIYHIPDREREGHGIKPEFLQPYLAEIRVLLTCDTGITAHDAVTLANAHGVDVIVTDHHSLPRELPPAYANVNPRRLPDPDHHPLGTLPGVGVAYQVILALQNNTAFTPIAVDGAPLDQAAQNVDLVALGIVADVAVQQGDARYLLQRGIEHLRRHPRPAIRALTELARMNDAAEIDEEGIGFQIAPRLNALGRLSDAAQGVELLLTPDIDQARQRAVSVEQLNAYRRMMSDQTFAAALDQIERDRDLLDMPVLVLGSAAWIPGIVGVVANRVVEQVNRPVILFGAASPRDDGGTPLSLQSGSGESLLKGSARSTAGIDITAAIAKTAADHPDLIVSFGGHTMAAGVTIAAEKLVAFRYAINHAMRALGFTTAPTATVEIAANVALADITRANVEALHALAPFGVGNPPLILAARHVRIESKRDMGRSGEHARFTISDARGDKRTVIWWRAGMQADDIHAGGVYDLAFIARPDDYKDRHDVFLEWVDAHAVEAAVSTIVHDIDVIDQRGAATPEAALRAIQARHPDAVVYAEVHTPLDHAPFTLTRSETLVIWTAPDQRSVLKWLIDSVQPARVYWFGFDPQIDTVQAFTRRLAGLAKFAIAQRDGRAMIAELARAMAADSGAVMLGLSWLSAKNIVHFTRQYDEIYFTDAPPGTPPASLDEASFRLTARLAETAAYRRYLRDADIGAIRRQML